VLLVFSSPGCGPCFSLAPELERFHYAQQESKKSPLLRRQDEAASGAQVVMISKGEPKENRLKAKEQGLTFPIVLQQQWEISRRYGIFTTPVAYLISEDGIILEDVAVGIESILKLLARASASSNSSMPNNTAIQGHEDLLRSQC
jgi:hypothetical protein